LMIPGLASSRALGISGSRTCTRIFFLRTIIGRMPNYCRWFQLSSLFFVGL
jgi:hypothetical protein